MCSTVDGRYFDGSHRCEKIVSCAYCGFATLSFVEKIDSGEDVCFQIFIVEVRYHDVPNTALERAKLVDFSRPLQRDVSELVVHHKDVVGVSSLEDLAGQPVIGYRAPSFSITPRSRWAVDVLLEEGYRYDSSVFPIRRGRYGDPTAPRSIHPPPPPRALPSAPPGSR